MQLAGVPSIWQRASLRRHQQLPESCEAFEGRLAPVIREAIESGELYREGELKTQVDAFIHGLWAVNMGNAYITYVFTPEAMREAHMGRLQRDVHSHVLALYQGYGWHPEDSDAEYAAVTARCARLMPEYFE